MPPRKKSEKPSVSLLQLRAAANQVNDEFYRSRATRKAYKGYQQRARAWIKETVAEMRDDLDVPPGVPAGAAYSDADFDLLAVALDGPANVKSPEALTLFLTFKCHQEGCGMATADGAYSALKFMWDT